MSETVHYAKGLEGVIVTESAICKIDGAQGLLSYRGYRIEELANAYDFEQVSYLILKNKLPDGNDAAAFCQKLRNNRAISERALSFIASFPAHAHPMDILQAIVPFLGAEYCAQNGAQGGVDAEHLIAQFATVVAAIHHAKAGTKLPEPRPDLNHGANFLYMLFEKEPSEIAAKVMDICLVLHAEHSLNASTFTARVISSTLADCYSSISGAVGSLSGPLHGGANEKVLQMVDEIGTPENTEQWVDDALAKKKKIMGMGHRVYKAKDPRAIVIERLLAMLNKELPHNTDYEILKKVEARVGEHMRKNNRLIYPNVDFFSGAAYRMLNIPTNLFTPIFALARVTGWMAHIQEQLQDNRIYRPKAHYIGPDIKTLSN